MIIHVFKSSIYIHQGSHVLDSIVSCLEYCHNGVLQNMMDYNERMQLFSEPWYPWLLKPILDVNWNGMQPDRWHKMYNRYFHHLSLVKLWICSDCHVLMATNQSATSLVQSLNTYSSFILLQCTLKREDRN